jgi:tol-pal system protein YbgF
MFAMIRKNAAVALMSLATLAASNIAHAGLFDDDEARKQIKQLAERVDAQNKENDARMQKLDESIKNIGVIQLLNQIELLNSEIAKLRGQVEVLANQNEQLQKRQKDFYLDIDTRLRTLEGTTGQAPVTSGVPGATPIGAPAGVSGVAPGAISTTTSTAPVPTGAIPVGGPANEALQRAREDKAYDVGTNAFRRGEFAAAIRAFQTFITDFPQSQLVSNALYWAGIAQFNLKDFVQARGTQEALLKRYPDSPKAPDAMLAIASIQSETGDAGSARNTFEDIIAKYPTSDAAAKARTRLAGIRR